MGTKFEEMERRYSELRSGYDKKTLFPEQFEQEINKLRLQDNGGTWWQVNIQDGTWLQWDGYSWIPGDPKVTTGKFPGGAISSGTGEMQEKPVSSSEFLKQFLKSMGISFKKGLPWMILTAVVIFIIQMGILTLLKPGTMQGQGALFTSALVMPGNVIEGMIFWALLAWLVATGIGYLRSRKFESPINHITNASQRIGDAIHDSGALFLPLFGIGLLSALLVGATLNNGVIAFQLALVSSAWLMAQGGSGMALFIGLIWQDITGYKTTTGKNELGRDHYITTGLFGLFIGFLISIFTTLSSYIVVLILVLVLVIILAVLISRRGPTHG